MPATHVVTVSNEPVYIVEKDGVQKRAYVLQRKNNQCYVHYLDTDKRMDEWVVEDKCSLSGEFSDPQHHHSDASTSVLGGNHSQAQMGGPGRKRKRGGGGGGGRAGSSSPRREPSSSKRAANGTFSAPGTSALSVEETQQFGEVIMTEEEYDLEQHKQIMAKRNFEDVYFGDWKIKTWYYSPYPIADYEEFEVQEPANSSLSRSYKLSGVPRTTGRSHARTVDLFAGHLSKRNGGSEKMSNLWVCDRCFKYFSEGVVWEIHKGACDRKRPPGRKVYERGAHIIWEIDGSQEKLYCQNLSLFGKLFIDVKTLYFDCDNFLFYVLTDGDSQREHIIGFFSKEKHSFDDYNLACIMTLPQYQRKGYGMLMIEFSYELSRRAGKVGTPERPLSDLGLRSYLAYWVATVVRFLRRVCSTLPPNVEGLLVRTTGNYPDLSKGSPGELIDTENEGARRRKKILDGDAPVTPLDLVTDPIFTKQRTFETTANPDGSSQTHVTVRCTLGDIAKATNLRIDDAAFALNECGLLMKRLASEEESDTDVVVITRAMVEEVAKERRVKKMCMDLRYVKLDEHP